MTTRYGACEEEDEFEPRKEAPGKTPSLLRMLSTSAVFLVATSGAMWIAQQRSDMSVPEYAAIDETSTMGEARRSLLLDNDHTRRTGREIGDGRYNFQYLAQVYKPTRLRLDNSAPATWEVDGVTVSDEDTSSVEVTFTDIGKHTVVAVAQHTKKSKKQDSTEKHTFEVHVRSVRYEIRDLSHDDREAYFHAMHVLYTIDQADGMETYGDSFKSIAWLVNSHLNGAADRACDHWHDDAGIMNHHIGITWQMEQSLRMIDPGTAAHYWDYTRDTSSPWYESDIFRDDWFGSNSPNNNQHVIDTGRWAYTHVLKNSELFDTIKNPYGILRSPWNTNPIAFVMRSNMTLGVFGDGYSQMPTCSEFAMAVGDSLGTLLQRLNGQLHGPVHIMIGGHWDYNPIWKKVMNNVTFPDNMLLVGKFLWRQGFVRTPELCSDDTPHAECMPYCPLEIVGKYNPEDILKLAGVFNVNADSNLIAAMNAHGLDYKDLLDELCHIGSPGEMFTSAAPQDPTFWPLHGNAERFVQYLRLLKDEGLISMDETWDYEHGKDMGSDTGVVCEWSHVKSGSMEMPKCKKETCPGHKADDLLPFEGLMSHQESLYTNLGFYKMTHPDNENLPYVYDSLSYWEACYENSLYDQYLLTSKPQMPSEPVSDDLDDSVSSTNPDDSNPPTIPDDSNSVTDDSNSPTNPDDTNSLTNPDDSNSLTNPDDQSSVTDADDPDDRGSDSASEDGSDSTSEYGSGSTSKHSTSKHRSHSSSKDGSDDISNDGSHLHNF